MQTLTKAQYVSVIRGFVASRQNPAYADDEYYQLGRRVATGRHRRIEDGLRRHGYAQPPGQLPRWSVLPPSTDRNVHPYLTEEQRADWVKDQRDWLNDLGDYADHLSDTPS